MKRIAGMLVLTLTVGIAAALIGWAGVAWAQDATKVVKADEVPWKDHPVFPGAHIAILVGDPTKAEVVVQRVKFPPNYRVAPHTHPSMPRWSPCSAVPSGAVWGTRSRPQVSG